MSAPTRSGYLALLARRPAYRSIWLGSVVSLAGDWFTLIALYSLLEEATGRSESIGVMLAARFIPPALLSPLAGVVADRLPRRAVMVTCDLLRAVVVLLFLAVDGPDDVWLVYLLTFVQMSISAFFDPAEHAAIASVVEPDEVVTANTIQGATWSAMLGLGAFAGGVTTALVGRQAAFVIDAGSYLLSAALIARAAVPALPAAPEGPVLARVLADLREGLDLVRARADLRRTLFVKTGWAVPGGAAILLYAVMGERVFPVGGSKEAGIGVLLAMRGLGALVGPLVARRLGGDDPRWLERAIGRAFIVTAVAWVLFAWAPSLPAAALWLLVAHTGVSTQWVFSSSLIALRVEDRLRGRVFSLDFMLYLTVLGLSSWAGGLAMDTLGIGPRPLMSALSAVLLCAGAVWWWLSRSRSR